MPLMPGSPRPDTPAGAAADDGVYRSIFQQPQLEIPAIAPSYSWFEFLLHPDALQRHLKTLRHQRAHGTHGATSAMELVREFLDQAQLVADEGNGRNNRYHALLRVAAQVALQMEIPLESIEKQLPAHFQRLLLDGIVDLAEADEASGTSSDTATISTAQAHLLHQRWTLRTLVHESQNGYLTSTNKNDAEEQMSGFQVALSELAQHHLQIAQSLQQALADDRSAEALPVQTQFDAFFDLAVYFFSFSAYEKAYECFSRASELLEDHCNDALAQLPATQRASLEGYLAACESVLESRSTGDTVMTDVEDSRGDRFGGRALDADEVTGHHDVDPRTEALLLAGAKRQRDHYRAANDLHGFFAAVQSGDAASTKMDPAALAAKLRRGILQKADGSGLPDDRRGARNLVVFLMLHSCWDALAHWRELLPDDHSVRPLVEFAIACGSLVQYVASTVNTAPPSDADTRQDFSVTRCNSILNDVLTKRRELLTDQQISPSDDSDHSGVAASDSEIAALLVDLPLWVLDTLVCVCAGLLHRSSMRSLSDHRVSFDLNPYGDVALLVGFAQENPKKKPTSDPTTNGDADAMGDASTAPVLATTAFVKASLPEIVALHARGVQCLVRRCPREPRWHSARADLSLYPIVRLKQPSLSDPRAALCSYLAAASLATNYFADDVSVVDIIDQSSLVRLSQCLVKTGAHVAAAVLYQCFAPDESKYGLRVLQIAPESHDAAFFQYFWALPFLELLVHLHSNPRHFNHKYVTLLTHLLQSPELNCSNPASVQKEVEQRILRCYFRDLCKNYLG